MLRKVTVMSFLVALTAAGATAQNAPGAAPDRPGFTSEGWHGLVAPYLWALNTSGDVAVGPVDVDFDLPFTTALEQLKAAFQVRGELRKGRLGIAGDFTNLEVAKGGAFSRPLPDGSSTDGDLDLRIQLLEAWPYYRLGDDDNAFDLMAGLRYYSFRTAIDFKRLDQGVSRQFNWTDPLVGVRWLGQVSPKVVLIARADLAGFGAGSELTLNLQGGVHWQFSRVAGLAVEYRWMDIDYEAGAPERPAFFKFDASMHGAVAGVTFAW